MGEGKRRTAEHWQIAARMQQLDALKLQEVEILSAMAEHMEDFHRLLTSSTSTVVDALCEEFATEANHQQCRAAHASDALTRPTFLQ